MAQTGVVKFFDHSKGHGFIKPDDGGHEVFVDISAVKAAGWSTLEEGRCLQFDVEPGEKDKDPKAVNLALFV